MGSAAPSFSRSSLVSSLKPGGSVKPFRMTPSACHALPLELFPQPQRELTACLVSIAQHGADPGAGALQWLGIYLPTFLLLGVQTLTPEPQSVAFLGLERGDQGNRVLGGSPHAVQLASL